MYSVAAQLQINNLDVINIRVVANLVFSHAHIVGLRLDDAVTAVKATNQNFESRLPGQRAPVGHERAQSR